MKNLILLFISFLMISITGNAQDILDGAYDRKTTYENRKVQPYPHLRQADVMWSRKIWREIDLREKVNHPFYYPAIQPGQEKVNDRRSLIDVVMDAGSARIRHDTLHALALVSDMIHYVSYESGRL